jgi:hypothetical protein
MSKINQKPNWQSPDQGPEHEIPNSSIQSNRDKDNQTKQEEVVQAMELKNESKMAAQDSGLDMNLVILAFQEKIAQLTTELVIKEATIKQLTNMLNKMRG